MSDKNPSPEPLQAAPDHRVKVSLVFFIVVIDLIGFGMIMPILPLYADMYHPSPVVFGLFMASFSLMQFIAAPILGRLSDRFGRRPVLLISLLGSAVGYFLFGFAKSLEVLFISRIIDGISGGNISTAHAVISDITGGHDRAKSMGMIGAAFGLGFILGPAFGGLLVQVALWAPGVGAAVLSLIAFVLVWFKLPETRNPDVEIDRRHPLSSARLGGAVAQRGVPFCLVGVFLMIAAFSAFEATFAQHLVASFGLTKSGVTWMFVLAGVFAALVQGGLVRRLAPKYGERKLVLAGGISAAAGLALLPFATSIPILLIPLGLLALGFGLASPSLTSLVSRLVPAGVVGAVMGVYQSMSSLGRVAGPFGGEVIYGHLGATELYILAGCLYAGLVVVIAVGYSSLKPIDLIAEST